MAETASQTKVPLGTKIAGILLVDSPVCRRATDLAVECYAPSLLNHAVRTYLFGALVGKAGKMQFDRELFYLACILHDIGLTSRYMGPRPFEIEGAEAARTFLEQQGFPKERTSVVWDGIALHANAAARLKQPEIALVESGTGTDVLGAGLEAISASAKAEVLAAFPRLKFKTVFVRACAEVVRHHPRGASRGFMRDIGERYVPGFKPNNICDAIDRSPFDE